MPTIPTWIPASLVMLSAVIGALYVMLSAVATFATAFWPQSTAAHYLAAAVLDLAKIRSMLAGFLPGSVAKVAATTLVAMCFALGGCAWFKSTVEPIIAEDGAKFLVCVEGKAAELGVDLVTGNLADVEKVALACGGSAVDAPVIQTIETKRAAQAKASLAAHPAASASAK